MEGAAQGQGRRLWNQFALATPEAEKNGASTFWRFEFNVLAPFAIDAMPASLHD
jgi:hypothetical protein